MIAKLDAEDLGRWRMVMADKELVDIGATFYSREEGKQVILRYYQTLDDIIRKYEVEIFPDTHLIVSPVSGDIIRASSD